MANLVEVPNQSSNNEDNIDRLFPKCRPRGDINQNRRQSCDNNNMNSNSSDPPPDNALVSAYNISDLMSSPANEDSTTDDVLYHPDLDLGRIEIAGGRELFSKSRRHRHKRQSDEVVYHPANPPSDLKRLSGLSHHDSTKHCMYNLYTNSIADTKSFLGDFIGNNNSNLNNKFNSHRAVLGIEEKSSSIESNYNGSPTSSKTSQDAFRAESPDDIPDTTCSGNLVYETLVQNAEIVYDDIGDVSGTEVKSTDELHVKTQDLKVIEFPSSNGEALFSPRSDYSPEGKRDLSFCDVGNSPIEGCLPAWKNGENESTNFNEERSTFSSPETNTKTESSVPPPSKQSIPRIIGNLPIAEYEGSPKRYGPRPGYPQRIMPNSSSGENSNIESNKLVSLIVDSPEPPPAPPSSSQTNYSSGDDNKQYNGTHDVDDLLILNHDVPPCDSDRLADKTSGEPCSTDFSELEYRLYRVNAAASSTYVGRRLAEPFQDLLLLHERVHQLNGGGGGSGAGSDLGGDTEVGEQVGGGFTLSPETTDCDSNDVESVVSLDGPAAMPVLEDGLSSGHSSDDDGENSTADSPTARTNYLDDLVRDCGEQSPPQSVDQAIQEIKQAIQLSKAIHLKPPSTSPPPPPLPVWLPRKESVVSGGVGPEEEEQPTSPAGSGGGDQECVTTTDHAGGDECDTDQETDRLLGAQRDLASTDADHRSGSGKTRQGSSSKKKNTSKEVLIEGVLFRARYLGSTLLVCEGQPTKATRMMQAEEAVTRIKSLAPEGESQPSTEIDLFISTEKIMVLNTDLKEIMMDHALRTISYIADIGDLVVLMARRRILAPTEDKAKQPPKMICHVFESEEAQFIAQSIGQAFQVAYMEFLKANGIEDSSFVREMDYQEVLNSQQIFGNELEMFAKKEKQKEVVVPKQKGEILGLVIVESGWGSMLPTVVVANMAQASPAARCGHLNIGDQIIAINGVSLVGLPLSTCQAYIKNTKTQTVVKLTVVPCAPVVEVKIKRPDTKYQLGFSVQNGVICSLLRGGIAERGGVRVGHRIIEINGQSVVAVPHERIVNLLATSVGEINMKTMPTSMFRLLTGQETPVFM